MPAPRAHVFSTCVRGAGIHGDVSNENTVTRGRFGSTHGCFFGWTHGSSASRCLPIKIVFLIIFMSILTGCWVHLLSQIFCLPKNAHIGLSRASEVHRKKPLDLTSFKFENTKDKDTTTTTHHTTPHHPTNHPTAHTHMKMYMYFCKCMCMCKCTCRCLFLLISQEKKPSLVWNTYLP